MPGEPLAARLRPTSLAEYVGQSHLVGPGAVLLGMIRSGRLHSLVLWGPPGTGKTTLIRLLAKETGTALVEFSAVTSGIADVRKVVVEARDRRAIDDAPTALFIDELHRFNKAQQDAFLPHVENGTIILLGATTENPYFSVNAALLSRLKVYKLEPLSNADLGVITDRALAYLSNEAGTIALSDEARTLLIELSGGDARFVIGALEIASDIARKQEQGKGNSKAKGVVLEAADIEAVLQQRALLYDKTGDAHYDTISAFIKSVRGSAIDGALHYLARMLEAGEDPAFIARRLVILAAEDVGLANPMAMVVANAAREAVEFIGMPEAHYPLAQAAIYLAGSPKSNTAGAALHKARSAVREGPNPPVPLHLRNAPVPRMAIEHGISKGYLYPHSVAGSYLTQQYLPEGVSGLPYYTPKGNGEEREIIRYLEWIAKQDARQGTEE